MKLWKSLSENDCFLLLFTNHKFRVGLHVGLTFGLNDRHIPIQYPSFSVKGFGEAIELLIARWVKPNGLWLFVLTHYDSWPTWSTLQTQKQELIF